MASGLPEARPDMAGRRTGRSRLLIMSAILALIALLAAACGTQAGGSGAAQDDGDRAAGGSASNLPRDFELSLYQGEDQLGAQQLRLSDVVAQGKPVVVNFYAGLCPPCRVEMPHFQALHEERGDQITVVSVDLGPFTGLGSKEDGKALLEQLDVSYPAGSPPSGDMMNAYKVLGMPTTVFLTSNGEVMETFTGALNEEKLNELASELIAQS